MAYRDQDVHLRQRLRALTDEAERRLAEVEAQAQERLRRARARSAALERELPDEIARLKRENERLERMLWRERQEYYGGRALVCGALGIWFGALAGIGIWFALSNVGLVLFFVVFSGLCGAGLGYFFER